jgi:protein-L-isoaspartate(D-aspartate) O-methyltransferase
MLFLFGLFSRRCKNIGVFSRNCETGGVPSQVIGVYRSFASDRGDLSGTPAARMRQSSQSIMKGMMIYHSFRFSWLFSLALLVLVGLGLSCSGNQVGNQEDQLKSARLQMVEQQLRQRGIRDERVLQAMAEIPRHLFVPAPWRSYAYDDGPLPIGEEQTISQPYIVALMSESLLLTGTETVLEIGTGSGYQAAVLSHLARRVYSIEILPGLAETARERLATLGFDNVTVIVGDGNHGWAPGGPYSAIMVTAAAPQVPRALVDQLAEGGRLVLPVERRGRQHLLRLRKIEGRLIEEDLGLVQFVPLVGGEPSPNDK